MSNLWLAQQERGHRWAYQFMLWVALRLGRKTARTLLYPICTYYVLFSWRASKGITTFLRRVLKRRITIKDLFSHYHAFASTLLDRTYILANQRDEFDLTIRDLDVLLDRVDRKQGCLLLGSHLGSFDILRATGLATRNAPIKLLMHQENAPIINEVFGKLDPSLSDCIIPVGEPDTMLRAKDCLDAGGLVGMLGDRPLKNDKVVFCDFLGHTAQFPSGPMLIASILKVPVVLFFCLYRGAGRYDIHFELFAESVIIPREHRTEGLQEWTQRYALRLEAYCRLAPNNWFNFYDFCETDR
jgi:predicted LPLAT superfamily acyltransferase